jgi:hypothetical protein
VEEFRGIGPDCPGALDSEDPERHSCRQGEAGAVDSNC